MVHVHAHTLHKVHAACLPPCITAVYCLSSSACIDMRAYLPSCCLPVCTHTFMQPVRAVSPSPTDQMFASCSDDNVTPLQVYNMASDGRTDVSTTYAGMWLVRFCGAVARCGAVAGFVAAWLRVHHSESSWQAGRLSPAVCVCEEGGAAGASVADRQGAPRLIALAGAQASQRSGGPGSSCLLAPGARPVFKQSFAGIVCAGWISTP